MFELLEKQTSLFQWDLNRKLTCTDETIVQVHFYKTKEEVFTVDRKEGEEGYYFEIPNILLQTAGNLRFYAYNGEATLFQQQLQIIARPKPSGYIYTETELYSVEEAIQKGVAAHDASEQAHRALFEQVLKDAEVVFPLENVGKYLMVGEDGKIAVSQLSAGQPIAVSTAAEMDAILSGATEASVGTLYLYQGETTENYEYGEIYEIAKEEDE